MKEEEKILREFIDLDVKNSYKERSKREPGFLDKIKSFFTGTGDADKISNEWLDDMEMSYGFDIPEKIEKEVKSLVRSKFDDIMIRTDGDVEKAERIIRKALDRRFMMRFRELERRMFDDDERF